MAIDVTGFTPVTATPYPSAMRVTDLMEAAHNIAFERSRDLQEAWIAHSFKLGAIAGVAHLHAIQANGRLDLVIRQLEAEWQPSPEGHVDFAADMLLSLSECWILRTYEVVRAAEEQLRSEGGPRHEQFNKLKLRFGLVRMPVAKAEIQGKQKAKQVILAHEDGSNTRQYTNDGKYVVPRQLCAETGSLVWCTVDVERRRSEPIRRIDLSNELLNLFD